MDDKTEVLEPHSPERPHGPDEVSEALVNAAAKLFAERGDVSVRAIAREAGVNHGLIHHYFGGKDGLRGAVLDQLAFEISEDLDEAEGGLKSFMAQAMQRMMADNRFVRVLARALLNDEIPEPFQNVFPVVQRMLREAKNEGLPDPEAFVAESVATSLGAIVFGPWIRQALGLSEDEAYAVFARTLARRGQLVDELKAANASSE